MVKININAIQRDMIIKEMGIQVLRIKNEELQDMTKVLDRIGGCLV